MVIDPVGSCADNRRITCQSTVVHRLGNLNTFDIKDLLPDFADIFASVIENGGEKEVKLVLSVAESDMGMVIGKGGKIAKAIRTVMKAAAATDGRRVNVEIRD